MVLTSMNFLNSVDALITDYSSVFLITRLQRGNQLFYICMTMKNICTIEECIFDIKRIAI